MGHLLPALERLSGIFFEAKHFVFDEVNLFSDICRKTLAFASLLMLATRA
jgi:hypothetical protein